MEDHGGLPRSLSGVVVTRLSSSASPSHRTLRLHVRLVLPGVVQAKMGLKKAGCPQFKTMSKCYFHLVAMRLKKFDSFYTWTEL